MQAHDQKNDASFKKRFRDLESDIEAFKGAFHALLSTLTSLNPDALNPKVAAIQDIQQASTNSSAIISATNTLHSDLLVDELWEQERTSKTQTLGNFKLKWQADVADSAEDEGLDLDLHIESCRDGDASWPTTLKTDWPQSLNLRLRADEDCRTRKTMRNAIRSLILHVHEMGSLSNIALQSWDSLLDSCDESHIRSTTISFRSVRTPRFMMTPTHPLRLFLDLCSVLCLCYDLMAIPFFLAWDIEANGPLRVVQLVTACFWTIDIIATFRTGYYHANDVVIDPRKIATHYIKRSFVLEFALVLLDWISLSFSMVDHGDLADNTGGTAKIMRLGKLSRLLRLAGVFRIAKFLDLFARIVGRNISNQMLIVLECFMLILTIVYINHVLACVWFAIALHSHSDTGARWTDGRYEEATPLFQYTTALHWALAQTSGSMEVNAQNSVERIFNVVCLLSGVFFFTALISSLSAKMMDLRVLNAKRTSQLNMMTSFLVERQVASDIAFLVKQQVQERMNTKEPLLQRNVEALQLLGESLQAELHFTICRPALASKSVFVIMFHLDSHNASQICFRAMDFMALNRQDILFGAGGVCNDAYMISHGLLKYTQRPETALVQDVKNHRVDAGIWLSEASLWSEWIHVGTTECVKPSEILKINSLQLIDATRNNLVLRMFLCKFGRAYHSCLTSTCFAKLNDLCGDAINSSHILSTMDKDVLMLVSFVSIEILSQRASSAFCLKKLREEIRLGKTSLLPTSDTEVHRCVHVSCLKLSRPDGHILALLGEWDDLQQVFKIGIRLPGTKIMGWENPEGALARFMGEDLPILRDLITLEGLQKEHSLQTSSNYNMVTEYTRNVYEAKIDPSVAFPELIEASTAMKPTASSGSAKAKKRPSTSSSGSVKSFWSDIAYFTFEGQQHKHVYAWLSQERYAVLTTETSKAAVNGLVQGFDIDEAIELNANMVSRISGRHVVANSSRIAL